MAARRDFKADRGGRFKRTLYYKASGAPIPLQGATFTVRSAYGAAPALLTLTEGDGIALNPATGQILIMATGSQMDAFTVPLTGDVPPRLFCVYDLWVKLADGSDKKLLDGLFIVGQRVR